MPGLGRIAMLNRIERKHLSEKGTAEQKPECGVC